MKKKTSSGKRPLKYLIWARDRMMKNLPKLDRLVAQRGGKSRLHGKVSELLGG